MNHNNPTAAGARQRGDFRQRVLHAAPAAVFDLLRDPARLARWWGPAGFSSSFEHFDFVPGGRWRFTMHGPDGKNYPNENVFAEIVDNERVIIDHPSPQHNFRLTLELSPHAEGTLLRWSQVFDTAEHYDSIASFVAGANAQNLDRLAAELARGG